MDADAVEAELPQLNEIEEGRELQTELVSVNAGWPSLGRGRLVGIAGQSQVEPAGFADAGEKLQKAVEVHFADMVIHAPIENERERRA